MNLPTVPRARPHSANRRAAAVAAIAVLVIAVHVVAVPVAFAAPYIEYLYPAGAQPGRSLEITLGGKSLDGAREVWVSGEGVTGEVLEVREPTEAQIQASKARDEVASQTARLRLTLAPGAAAGVRDLRVMARAGLSNRFRFEIGGIPEVLETEPNNSLETAQSLPALPVIVNGQATNADRDFFRFRATAGERLLLRVRARAIKPYLADAVPGWFQARLALFDAASGKKIIEVDNFRHDPDPVLLWEVPADGEYIVSVWDALSRGRDDFVYRLAIGCLPFVTDIHPLGAPAGKTTTVTARGINLAPPPPARVPAAARTPAAAAARVRPAPEIPPLPLDTVRFHVRFDKARAGIQSVAPLIGNTPANPLPFEIGELPEFTEPATPHGTPALACNVTTPIVINGKIEHPGETDYYAFNASKGQSFVVDVMARRLDSPLDARLRVGPEAPFNALPKPAANTPRGGAKPPPAATRGAPVNDDTKDERHGLVTHHADARVQFTTPAAGTYHIAIEDTLGHGGPEYSYRLRIAPPQPDFELRVMPDNMVAPAGGNAVVQLKAFRTDGFDGAVHLRLDGLPDGFELGGATIPAGKKTATFTLAVPPDAKPGVHRPRFHAEAEFPAAAKGAPPRRVRHDVSAAEELMQAFFYTHTVPVAQSYLIVSPPSPFTVEVFPQLARQVSKTDKPDDANDTPPPTTTTGATGAANAAGAGKTASATTSGAANASQTATASAGKTPTTPPSAAKPISKNAIKLPPPGAPKKKTSRAAADTAPLLIPAVGEIEIPIRVLPNPAAAPEPATPAKTANATKNANAKTKNTKSESASKSENAGAKSANAKAANANAKAANAGAKAANAKTKNTKTTNATSASAAPYVLTDAVPAAARASAVKPADARANPAAASGAPTTSAASAPYVLTDIVPAAARAKPAAKPAAPAKNAATATSSDARPAAAKTSAPNATSSATKKSGGAFAEAEARRLRREEAARLRAEREAERLRREEAAAVIRVKATRGGRGIETITAILPATGGEGVIRIQCDALSRVGEEGVLIVEAVQRLRGRRTVVIAPAIPFKIVPATTAPAAAGKSSTSSPAKPPPSARPK